MEEKENKNFEAGAIPQGLTKIRIQNLYELGKNVGLTKENIRETLQKKKWIQNCLVIFIALVITTTSYAIFSRPAHYLGISIQDFNTIGQMMYRVFGRIF
jgi:hypothetical protein